ncbi:MAG: hypothetical protein OXC48_01890, partial [Endozoicomonadaceae bacterium]|nr:hypothetical protein [Endozoicomonadaceae bacterium]
AGAVITTGLTVATLGASAATYGGTLLASAVTAGTAAAGAIPVVAAAIPANHGLNIAASVEGFIEMGAIIATAAVDTGLFFATPVVRSNEYKLRVLNMLKLPSNDDPTPNYDANSPIALLKNKAGDLVNLRRQRLELKSLEDVGAVWKILKSEKNNLVGCDIGTICLVASLNKEPLQLQALQRVLRLKAEVHERDDKIIAQKIKIFSEDDPKLLRNAKKYLFFIRKVLEKLNPVGGDYFDGIDEDMRLDEILTEPGVAVVELMLHIGVIQRFEGKDNLWGAYFFKEDGTIEFKKDSMQTIEEKFYSLSPGDDKSIAGYMIL